MRGSLEQPGGAAHDDCIERLLRFDQWHYQWPTQPPLLVIDSRTHRWRSELSARQPMADGRFLTFVRREQESHWHG